MKSRSKKLMKLQELYSICYSNSKASRTGKDRRFHGKGYEGTDCGGCERTAI